MGLRNALSTVSFAVVILHGADASRVEAQARPALGVIDGAVTDTSLASLADASVSILGSTLKVVTGSNGRFQILAVPAGHYILVVRRLGFAPVSSAVQVAAGDTVRASFALERLVTALDTVKVAAKRLSTRMAEFEDRRKFGQGQFMTQAEIEKRNALYPEELIRSFMGVNVVGGHALSKRMGLRGCPMQFFVDGVAILSPDLTNDLPTPKELAGIEVYTGSATVPLQYKTMRGGGSCGVILIWTR